MINHFKPTAYLDKDRTYDTFLIARNAAVLFRLEDVKFIQPNTTHKTLEKKIPGYEFAENKMAKRYLAYIDLLEIKYSETYTFFSNGYTYISIEYKDSLSDVMNSKRPVNIPIVVELESGEHKNVFLDNLSSSTHGKRLSIKQSEF